MRVRVWIVDSYLLHYRDDMGRSLSLKRTILQTVLFSSSIPIIICNTYVPFPLAIRPAQTQTYTHKMFTTCSCVWKVENERRHDIKI